MTFSRWKIFFVAFVVLLGAVTALPNFLSEPARQGLPDFLPSKTLSLGLDLQGGVQLLLAADAEDIIATRLENIATQVQDIRRSVRGLNFRALRVEPQARRLSFEVTRPEMADRAREELRVITNASIGVNPVTGLGVQEVTLSEADGRFTLTLTPDGIEAQSRDAIARTMQVIRDRVDPDGTREITVQPEGSDRIILQVPGADDPTALRRLIETAAKLTFHDVVTDISAGDIARGRIRASQELINTREGGQIVIRKRVIVSGEDLIDAKPGFGERGQPAVNFTFNATGARRFANHTRENVGRPFAIKLDDEVISAPVIQVPILNGSGQITGVGASSDAAELATLLKAGALPVKLTVASQSTVGPDLGADSIEAGTWAAIIGFAAVIVYMLLSYGGFGLAANLALIINLVLILGLLSLFQATLTLPGIAGIVLTIGMAVDANVLVFERIREEQAAGRSPLQALEDGYSQAFSTILDANITTFIAASLLYLLGTGPVQGFAVTLGIGILTSMFTAVVLTRLLLSLWFVRARPQRLVL